MTTSVDFELDARWNTGDRLVVNGLASKKMGTRTRMDVIQPVYMSRIESEYRAQEKLKRNFQTLIV